MNTQEKSRGFTGFEIASLVAIILVLGLVVFSAYSQAKSKARDHQRVSEVTQLQAALKSYYEENLSYPASNNGFPIGFDQYVKWPAPPSPADGKCGSEQNKYHYQKLNSNDYTISFCLGQDVKGYKAGIRKASPTDGIR